MSRRERNSILFIIIILPFSFPNRMLGPGPRRSVMTLNVMEAILARFQVRKVPATDLDSVARSKQRVCINSDSDATAE